MGGATFSVLSLMDGAKKYGYEPIAIIPNEDEYLENILRLKQIKYYIIPIIQFSYPKAYSTKQMIFYPIICIKKIITYLKNLRIIREVIKNEDIKLIHSNVGPIREGHAVAKRLNIPHVWHIREYGDRDFKIRYFPSKSYFRKSLIQDYVITITKDLIGYNRLQAYPKARVVYNGVRKQSDVYYEPKKHNYFLCASRISEEKGHHEVIEAFARFHKYHPEYKLIILGNGSADYLSRLKKLVNQNTLERHVVFEGFQTDVSRYMKFAKAVIVASYAEGFGRMTAEAMFAGCLVIGRSSGGTKEIIDITGGFLFKDLSELEMRMKAVAEMSTQSYTDQISSAQTKCIQYFSEEKYISNIVEFYRQATSEFYKFHRHDN